MAVAARVEPGARRVRFSAGRPEAASAGSSFATAAPTALTAPTRNAPVPAVRCRPSDVTTVTSAYRDLVCATAIATVLVARTRLVATTVEVSIPASFVLCLSPRTVYRLRSFRETSTRTFPRLSFVRSRDYRSRSRYFGERSCYSRRDSISSSLQSHLQRHLGRVIAVRLPFTEETK